MKVKKPGKARAEHRAMQGIRTPAPHRTPPLARQEARKRPRRGAAILLLSLLLLFGACRAPAPLRETALPASLAERRLGDSLRQRPLEYLEEWHPGDWRVFFLAGIGDPSAAVRLLALRLADSLNPAEPAIPYFIALEQWNQAHTLPEEGGREPEAERRLLAAALGSVLEARRRDPGNGMLEIFAALLRARLGERPAARALFFDPETGRERRPRHADGYLETVARAAATLFSDGNLFNPYGLFEMTRLLRAASSPPPELAEVLEKVYLEGQREHPYDIRRRAPAAARNLDETGRLLRRRAPGPRVFSRLEEERAWGFRLQEEAKSFLLLHHRNFGDTVAARRYFGSLRRHLRIAEEYGARARPHARAGASAKGGAGGTDSLARAYLALWEGFDPALTVGEASRRAARHPWYALAAKEAWRPSRSN